MTKPRATKHPLKLSASRWNWPKVLQVLADRLSGGNGLATIGEALQEPLPGGHELPRHDVLLFAVSKDPALKEAYDKLTRVHTELVVDRAMRLAAAAHTFESSVEIQGARLGFDAAKWYASVRLPEIYSDKQRVELSGGVQFSELKEALQGEGIPKLQAMRPDNEG